MREFDARVQLKRRWLLTAGTFVAPLVFWGTNRTDHLLNDYPPDPFDFVGTIGMTGLYAISGAMIITDLVSALRFRSRNKQYLGSSVVDYATVSWLSFVAFITVFFIFYSIAL
ncbi:MAG: hypothetical protein Phyf2KO_23630 [Phycisphaerales bacterium]